MNSREDMTMSLSTSIRCENIAPSVTLAVDARAKEMRAQGMNVISFGTGEPDFDTPAFIGDAAMEAIHKGHTRYTQVAGTPELRAAICRKLKRDNNLDYDPSQIIVSNGAKHSLFTIFQAILNPGDEVLIPIPCWVSYPELVRMAGGVPVYVRTQESNDFIPELDAIARAVTRRTKAIVITSPSNPNGSVWSREQLQGVADLAVKHGFYVVSDEIYEKLLYDGLQHVSIAQLGEDIKNQTLVVNGLSKAYAMTGWRIGYTAGPRNVIQAMCTFQSQASSNACSIAQDASAAALDGDQTCVEEMRKEFERRRDYMYERLNAIPGLSCIKPQGAFYIMMNIKDVLGKTLAGRLIDTSMDFVEVLLKEALVALVPGIAFEAEGYCRLSYATSMANIEEGLSRIENFLAKFYVA